MGPHDRSVAVAIAPTGARRTKSDHPALPITCPEIVAAAVAGLEAGAAMIHCHVRDADGQHSLDAELYREVMAAIRAAVGDSMIVQITTEAVGRFGPDDQMAVVRAARPEAVSLALRELCPGVRAESAFAEFLLFLERERIAPQFIIYEPDEVTRLAALVDRGVVPFAAPSVLYVLGRHVEGGASGPRDLLPFLAAAADRFPDFMVCAFGRQEAACGVAAALLGGAVRVGMENNLLHPDGTQAVDNAALVRAVLDPLERLGYRPETADSWRARTMGGQPA